MLWFTQNDVCKHREFGPADQFVLMVEWTTPMAEENGRVAGDMTRVDKGMLARLLFPNPVCLLSSRGGASDVRNVMTITWLTPINNQVLTHFESRSDTCDHR